MNGSCHFVTFLLDLIILSLYLIFLGLQILIFG